MSDTKWITECSPALAQAMLDVLDDIVEKMDSLEEPIIISPYVYGMGAGQEDNVRERRMATLETLRKRGVIRSAEYSHERGRRPGIWIEADENAVREASRLLRDRIERRPPAPAEIPAVAADPLARVLKAVSRFHAVASDLRRRREGREPLEMKDEYDVQYLLHALLRVDFDDIRPEEWTPSYAGKQARVDFWLKPEKIVVEVKMARVGHAEKEIGEELIIDIERYATIHGCETLVCLVYDPGHVIKNPEGFRADLNRKRNGLTVHVAVVPGR